MCLVVVGIWVWPPDLDLKDRPVAAPLPRPGLLGSP